MAEPELWVRWDGVGERYGTLTPCHEDSFSVSRVPDGAVERMKAHARGREFVDYADLLAAAVGGEGP